jgi:nucleolar complex protein 3
MAMPHNSQCLSSLCSLPRQTDLLPIAGASALKQRYKFKRRQQRDDAIAAAMQEASAKADIDEARLQQSLMLEALFELFFRVLKQCTTSGLLKGTGGAMSGIVVRDADPCRMRAKLPLLYVTLQGLGKYTHLISLEYFTDLLNVFQQLLVCSAFPMRSRLRCLLTVVEIMRAQGDALNIERKGFFLQLHDALALCPLEQVAADDGDESVYGDFACGAPLSGMVRLCVCGCVALRSY